MLVRCLFKIAILLTIMIVSAWALFGQRIGVTPGLRGGAMPIVYSGTTTKIFYSADDHKVVQIAAKDLAADIERVTGKLPAVSTGRAAGDVAILIGTLGKSPLIDSIADAGKLDAAKIQGKWESFIIKTIKRPLPNVERALVIAGSDRRGTAFGVYEVSQIIGVSPWYWWADATPERREDLILTSGTIVSREPSVRYRGIFINDEDWGLQPWAAKTFEPETGDIGPKTYAKVFELLLRLRANTLWPAMHEVTRPFNSMPANRQVADDYAIVMGSSHAEPMLRNNVGEWKADKDAFNFVTNPEGVTAYWEDRVRENGRFENIYTIGMRGIHDSPILGTKSQAERIPLLEKIFSVQRGLIAKHVDPNVEKVPQIFCPYKEVLGDYRAGLKVPEDVTIVFPDDNFGYIRQFPNAEEHKRKGGFGVYYHISYLGRPFSYLWLNTTPPALIWQEMNKAYENGMRQLWIVNVGDIKPGEIGMEFFLQMAYDAGRWTIEYQHKYLNQWAAREFGSQNASAIAAMLDEYYRLGYQRKPEHLQWYLPNEESRTSDMSDIEKDQRLVQYSVIRKAAEDLYSKLPAHKKDAFYQLVLYPVRSAACANDRFFAAEVAAESKAAGHLFPAGEWAKRSIAADNEIMADARYFNEVLANGKWRYIMSPEMNPGQWPSMRSTPIRLSPSDFDAGIDRRLPQNFPAQRNSSDLLDLRPSASFSGFAELGGVISIEAENFSKSTERNGFRWNVIRGLGKTGDSISVFPARAHTFTANDGPVIEFEIEAATTADFDAYFHLIPTQPLVPGKGLRLAFSIDGGKPIPIVADADTEVSSRKWAANVLDATTIARAKVQIAKGRHTLKIHAIDTGVVLDKIVLASKELPTSYFGPAETRVERTKK